MMQLRCCGERVPLSAAQHYSPEELYRMCRRARARYPGAPQVEAWLHMDTGGALPVPEEHLPFVCAVVAHYHNTLLAGWADEQ